MLDPSPGEMTGIRLIAREGCEFPYKTVRAEMELISGMHFEPLDIPAIVAAGVRMGWPPEVIDEHWELMRRGRCFAFHQEEEPGLFGSLYEDYLFFMFSGREHEDRCAPNIHDLATRLGLGVVVC
jgi:hypothetical protein